MRSPAAPPALAAALAAALLMPAGACAQGVAEAKEVAWGFGGKVTPGQFAPVSVLLDNPAGEAFDGTLRLYRANFVGERRGAELVEEAYLAPTQRRWVTFYVLPLESGETWVLRAADAAGTELPLFTLPKPGHAGPQVVLLTAADDVTARVRALSRAEGHEREIHETAENERERFGMDLHDGLGQTLAGVTMLSHALKSDLQALGRPEGPLGQALPPEVAERVQVLAQHAETLYHHVERTVGEARSMAYGLNPIDAGPDGLADGLQRLADDIAATHDDLTVGVDAEPVSFDDRRQARHLYRIAQEALANAARHADASMVAVRLFETDDGVALTVSDDGIGMERSDQLRPARSDPGGRGLPSMRYRADLIGAHFDIGDAENGGTHVRVTLPRDVEPSESNGRTAEA